MVTDQGTVLNSLVGKFPTFHTTLYQGKKPTDIKVNVTIDSSDTVGS